MDMIMSLKKNNCYILDIPDNQGKGEEGEQPREGKEGGRGAEEGEKGKGEGSGKGKREGVTIQSWT